MLPFSERLRSNLEFQEVYKQGTSFAEGPVVLYCLASSDPSLRHTGFTVSKKLGKAVTRNVIKRRLREAFRSVLPELPRGYKLIFVARRSAANADYAQLARAVRGALTKAGLLTNVV